MELEQRTAELEHQLACAEDFLHSTMAALIALASTVVTTATPETDEKTVGLAQRILDNFNRVFVPEDSHE